MGSAEEQSSLQLIAGDVLDKYSLTRRLGVGGMGEVWLAEDPALERQVAVKLLLPEYSSDPRFRERFRREAQTMMDLQNAPIVGVMNYFEADEPRTGRLLAAMVMQYMPGGTLEDRMEPGGARRPLPLDEALETATAALEALDEIHDAGIVHQKEDWDIAIYPSGCVRPGERFSSEMMQPPGGNACGSQPSQHAVGTPGDATGGVVAAVPPINDGWLGNLKDGQPAPTALLVPREWEQAAITLQRLFRKYQ